MRLRTFACSVLLALAAVSCGHTGTLPGRIGSFEGTPVDESSGLAASRTQPGVFWTHNDSGDSARVFAVTAHGQLLAEVALTGATHVDWEDIATDAAGHVYVADCGNNDNDRKDLVVYRFVEPQLSLGAAPAKLAVGVDRQLRFRYPDQQKFPDETRLNFDCEALFFAQGKLYLLTKHRSDTRTTLYRFPNLSGTAELSLDYLGEFDLGGADKDFGGRATAADATPDGQTLAVLSYHALFLFARPADSDLYLTRPLHRIDLDQRVTDQAEAVAWDGDSLLLTSESGDIFRIERPLDPATTAFP